MNDQRIAILTDSGTDTPADFVRAHDVPVVPLHINYSDGTSYRSGVDITEREVIERFSEEIPKTSLPSPQEILDLCEQAKADGYERGVFVTISSALSATNQTVRLVREQIEDFPLAVVDTKSIGVIAGLQVMEAVRLVESGVPFEDLERRLCDLSERSDVFFTVKDLYYLRQGGRISEAVYRLGSVLNIKPVLYCDAEGYYAVIKKARGWDKALASLVKLVAARAAKFVRVRVGICCSEADDCLDELEERVRREVPNVGEVIRSGLSPDLIVHTGPDLVGMGVQPLE